MEYQAKTIKIESEFAEGTLLRAIANEMAKLDEWKFNITKATKTDPDDFYKMSYEKADEAIGTLLKIRTQIIGNTAKIIEQVRATNPDYRVYNNGELVSVCTLNELLADNDNDEFVAEQIEPLKQQKTHFVEFEDMHSGKWLIVRDAI